MLRTRSAFRGGGEGRRLLVRLCRGCEDEDREEELESYSESEDGDLGLGGSSRRRMAAAADCFFVASGSWL